jgi:phage shock protein A
VARQLDIEAQLPVLETTLGEYTRQEGELQGYVAALLAKKREMQEALSEFRKSRAAAAAATVSSTGRGRRPATAEHRIDKRHGRLRPHLRAPDGACPGRRAATRLQQAAQLKELDDLVRDNKIAERMAQLKAGKA